ncbi:MAG: tetratricopeptide repeat protein [Armatimonadota bacterium]|nr:tetratricopeptide repeat protein [Armatimonadota bacterium]
MKLNQCGRLSVNILLACAVLSALTGCSRSKPHNPDPAADGAYNTILKTWGDGSQAGAESLLASAVTQYPDRQPLAFFQAACTRSRFDIQAAYPLFQHVAAMDSTTTQGRCAATMMQMDRRQDLEQGFETLRALVQESPTDPLLLWMLAIQCRSYKRNPEGAECYRKLLALIGPGPVLVHQTYANILDELGRHQEALAHRERAVQLEPATWSYDGWAGTLEDLGQDQKAYEVRVRAAKLFGRPMPDPPAPQAIDIPQKLRRRIYDESQLLIDRLMKQHSTQSIDFHDPALDAFRQKYHLTFEEYMDIQSEGDYYRWDLDTDPAEKKGKGRR